jgi:hypothetical protein
VSSCQNVRHQSAHVFAVDRERAWCMTMSERDSELSRSCVDVSLWQLVGLPVAAVPYPASLSEQQVASMIPPRVVMTI